jgi:GTP-binding protein
MVDDGQCRIVIADIPGLIEGASAGRGLGHQFLRHIERTRLLLYVLDVTHPCKEDLLEDFHALRNELFAYSPELIEKPSVVAVNKMDLYGKEHRDVEAMGQALEKEGMAFYTISALTGQGLDLFQQALREEATGLIGSQEDRSAGSMLTNPGEESQRSRMGKEGKQDQP